MAAEYGSLVDVSTTNVGENLTADAAVSATSIFVEDSGTFNELGGQLSLNGTVYTYTAVNFDTDEITLSSGLVADALEDDHAEVYPPKPVKMALVDFGIEESEAVKATVPHSLSAVLADGFYEEESRPGVLVDERTPGDLYIVDVAATPARIQVQEVTGDGSPPIASPTPVVEGWVGALHAKWAAISDSDPVEYAVHISTTTDFTPDATTLVGTTGATSFTIKSLPNDLPLAYDTDYYVKIVAFDLDGEAAAGSQGSGQMVPVTGPDIAANYVYAGRIAAPQIDGGEINADLTMSGIFRTAESGGRTEIDNTGVVIYDSSGVPQTVLAPDQSIFKGDVDAGGVTISDSLSVRGVNNEISTGGELYLAGGITAPSTAPTVVQEWESITFTKPGDSSFNGANLTSVCKVGSHWVCGYRDGSVYRIYRFDAAGVYHSLGADAITSSTALQTVQLAADGLCYTICSNHTIFRHKAMAANYTHIFTDDFTASINGTNWPTQTGGISWDSGTASAEGLADFTFGTVHDKLMKDSFVSAKVTRAGGTAGQDLFMTLSDDAGDDELAQIKLNGSTLTFRVYGPTPGDLQFESTLSYNATTHAWWKISEVDAVSGGDFKFSTSSDGVTWTERWSCDHDLAIGDLTDAQLQFTGQEEGASGTLNVFIDNVRHGLNNEGQSFPFTTLDEDDNPMVLGVDGSSLLLADHDNTGANDRLRVRTITNLTTMAVASTAYSDTNSIMDAPLAGILKGSFDLGATRWVFKRTGSHDFWSVDPSNGDWKSAEYFTADGGGSTAIVWDGSNFWGLGGGKLYKHTGVVQTNGTATVGWVYSYSWYDGAGTTHETTVSPVASVTLQKRARITVTTPDIPGAGGADDPDRIRIYAGLNSGAQTLQTTTAIGSHSATYNALVTGGGAPPGSGNFTAATPAKLKSSTGGLIISGDGTIVGGSFSGSLLSTELGNAVNLDTITTPGMYTQSSDAEAAAGSNYPPLALYAGVLEVFGVSAILMQRYSAYRNSDVNPSPNIWERTSVSGTWGAWQPINYDTGWITSIASVAVAASNMTLTAASIRRVNKTVQFSVDWEWDAGLGVTNGTGNLVDTNICTLVSRWRPTGAADQGGMVNNNGTRNVVGQLKDSGLLIAVTSAGDDDFAANLTTSMGGTYFMP